MYAAIERCMPLERHLEVMYLVLLLIVSTVRAQQCSDPVLFQPWEDAWLVRYNKQPCNPNSPWAAFCKDSGWGDEEATVVCREQGYSYGTGDFFPAYASAIGYSHIECEGAESALEQCSFGNSSLICSFVGVVTQCHTDPPSDDDNDGPNDDTIGDNNEGEESESNSHDDEDVGRDSEDGGTDNEDNGQESLDADGSENKVEDVAAKGSSAGVIAGVIIAVLVVVVMVMAAIIMVVLIWRKRRTRMLPATDGKLFPYSARETMNNVVESQLGPDLDNPVYGPVSGAEQSPPTHTGGEPEHKFINPLYHLIQEHTSQERVGSVSEHEYASLRTPYSTADRVIEGKKKDYTPYESEEY